MTITLTINIYYATVKVSYESQTGGKGKVDSPQ